MASVQAFNSNGPWDQNTPVNRPFTLAKRPAQPKSIPDDWDDDIDEEEDNQKIWQHANTRAPMPELIISSSTASSSAAPPPMAALQAPMRILKRPSASPNSNASSSSQTPTPETLVEREARYQVARERIFGVEDGSGTSLVGTDKSKRGEKPLVNVVRNPLGPSNGSNEGIQGQEVDSESSKGFKRRSGKVPPRPTQPLTADPSTTA